MKRVYTWLGIGDALTRKVCCLGFLMIYPLLVGAILLDLSWFLFSFDVFQAIITAILTGVSTLPVSMLAYQESEKLLEEENEKLLVANKV